MEACRACLATEQTMTPMDDTFVTAYNLLTNLNVSLSDSMPQYVCTTCSQSVGFYVDFRERCITTETSLRQFLQNVKDEKDGFPEASSDGKYIKVKKEVNGEDGFSEGYLLDHFTEENHLKEEDNLEGFFEENDNLLMKEEDNSIAEEGIKSLNWKPKKRKCKKNKLEDKVKVKKIIQKETEEIKLLCGLCEQTFLEKQDLSNHIESHKNDEKCGLCSEKVKTFPALVGHRLTHIPKEQKKCHLCKRRGYSCLHMEYHYMQAHFDGEKTRLACKLCMRTYKTPKQLKKHIKSSHTGAGIFVCDYCSKVCSSKQLLTAHIKSHLDKKTFVCDECGFACNYAGGLKDHKIRKHTKTKVICKTCSRPFANEQDKTKHKCNMRTIICPICGITVSSTKKYNRHIWVHSSVGRYKCTRCPAVYKSRDALKAHVNRHDGIRTMQCEFCPLKFYTASVLIKHRRTHTGEKPYVCKICNKGFTGNHNLKVHMKVHGVDLVVKKSKISIEEEEERISLDETEQKTSLEEK